MKTYKDENLKLDIAIAKIKKEKDLKLAILKAQLNTTFQSIKPSNIIQQTLVDLKQSTDFKENIKDVSIGILGGYLSKKILVGKSHSIFKKMMGFVVQYGMTYFLSNKLHKDNSI